MPLYRPSELRALLDKWGTTAKKSLSQNFLIDGNIIRKIAGLVPSTEDDIIIEIGPGPGALSEALLEKEALFFAVEKDRLFIQHLDDHFKENSKSTFYNDDILTFSFDQIFEKYPTKKVHVVGNLPYSITSPIIRKLSTYHSKISSITIMVQDEVGRRMTAKPKTKDFGLLTLGVQFYFDASYAFRVTPRCFYPPPKVYSAVIHLTPKKLLNVKEEDFFKVLKAAFNVRRKSLRSSLREYSIVNALEEMGKPPLSRPEELSIQEWFSLYTLISHPK